MCTSWYFLLIVLVQSTIIASGNPYVKSDHDDVSSPWILGGMEAADGQFPWTISIEFYGSLGWWHWCGGIIVKDYYAITGARCLVNRDVANLRVRAGLLWLNDTQATNAQLISVKNYVIHENFDPMIEGQPYDIAVLEFDTPFNFQQTNIEKALLPPNDTNLYLHNDCIINGWGRYSDEHKFSYRMLYAQIPVISNADCAHDYDTIANANIVDTHMCALSDQGEHGICNGDAGSPLNCRETQGGSGPLYVVGITSWGLWINENCSPYYPSVFTRVAEYLDWIETHTP